MFKTNDRCNLSKLRRQRVPVLRTSMDCTFNLRETQQRFISQVLVMHITVRLNLKISLDWSAQSKLCNIFKIHINRKKRRLLFNVNNFNSLRISCVHFRRPW